MEDRDCKDDVMQEMLKESPLEATSVKLAANIIQNTNRHLRWDVLKQSLDEGKSIVLTFTCMGHTDEPKDSIMTAE